jgi:hypothetical protein
VGGADTRPAPARADSGPWVQRDVRIDESVTVWAPTRAAAWLYGSPMSSVSVRAPWLWQATFTGYGPDPDKRWWALGMGVVTLGALPLAAACMPSVWLRLYCSPCAFATATVVVVQVRLCPAQTHRVVREQVTHR